MTKVSTQEHKTFLRFTNAIAQALEMQGINSQELFEDADIPYMSTVDPSYLIEVRKANQLYRLAIEETGNPSFGLKVAQYFPPSSFHALGYSLFASSTLHEFCQRLERFFRLLSENARHHFQTENDIYRLILEVTNPDLCYESVDAWLGCIVQICRNIYRPNFSPLRVELVRPEPATHAEEFERFFRAPVTFGAEKNAIYFDKSDIFSPLPTANIELAQRNDEVSVEYLARLEREDVVRQVEAIIIKLLPTGDCSREKIADALNMSPRTLNYKLKQKNTSYQEILEELRSALSQQYIKQKNLSFSQIAYLLGFTDTSNFSRAFRRWTGLSPSDYRRQK